MYFFVKDRPLFGLLLFFFIIFCCCTNSEDILSFEGNQYYGRVMIVPDIQNYTYDSSRFSLLEKIPKYYVANAAEFNACFQVGDFTNNNQLWQYHNADEHFLNLFPDDLKPQFCLGNHDYGDNGTSNKRSTNFPNSMKPIADILREDAEIENYARFITIGNNKFLVLELEFAPRNEAIEWASQIASIYSNTPIILLTHVFLNKYAQIHDSNDDKVYHGGSQKSYPMGGYINDSMEIFNKLIYNHPNIKLVISGHTLTPNYIDVVYKENCIGQKVYIITVNFQHFKNGGNGMVGVLYFGTKEYRIRSLSTINGSFGDIDIAF